MKKFLWVLAIVSSVLIGLGLLSGVRVAGGPPQPLELPAASQVECDCSHIKVLRLELRNALRLQQAFRNKMTELRGKSKDSSQSAFEAFAKGEAVRNLERIPNYDGPKHVDYYPSGRALSEDFDKSKRTAEALCRMIDSSVQELAEAKRKSACAGIGRALEAHENWHIHFCQTIGFVPYEEMHGADRAQEEAEAYGEQIKVLREIISRLRCGYRASGSNGSVVYSGLICSLEEPFSVTGTHPLFVFPFKFAPSSATAGRMSYVTSGSGISASGGGSYTIEGADTDTPRIVVQTDSTATNRVTSTSGGGTATINLVPLETAECQASQPR